MQQRGTRTPETQQKYRLWVYLRLLDPPAVSHALPDPQRREHGVGGQYPQIPGQIPPVNPVAQPQPQGQPQPSGSQKAVEPGAETGLVARPRRRVIALTAGLCPAGGHFEASSRHRIARIITQPIVMARHAVNPANPVAQTQAPQCYVGVKSPLGAVLSDADKRGFHWQFPLAGRPRP